MMSVAVEELSVEELQMLAEGRATFSSLLSVHFLNIPDKDFVPRLRSREFIAWLEQLACEAGVQLQIAGGASLMHRFLLATQDQPTEQLAQTLGVDRTRLYRGVSPEYGPPPPYEAEWVPVPQGTNALLQEIADLYHAGGLVQAPDSHERLDYIGIQLGYLKQLAAVEAQHWQAGDAVQARQVYSSQKSFFVEHLARWVPDFVEKTLSYAQTDFYRGHLLMLRGFIAEQVAIFTEIDLTDL
jgi:TorA maturation chaperone TorD